MASSVGLCADLHETSADMKIGGKFSIVVNIFCKATYSTANYTWNFSSTKQQLHFKQQHKTHNYVMNRYSEQTIEMIG